VQVFFIRVGKLIGREYFVLTGTTEEAASEILGSFVKQFYDEAAYVPPEILVQEDLDELAVLQEWLRRRRGTKVLIKTPRRGEKRAVMNMAIENATATLNRLRAEWEVDTHKHTEALAELQVSLGLPNPPARIECFDISNTQGTNAVGSMVVFAKGVPSKQDYRRFRIRTVNGPNDYASMAEVLRRRFARAKDAHAEQSIDGRENRWAIMPDLVIVDGGKGQLARAVAVLERFELTGRVPVVGLAKQQEELFLPGQRLSVMLPRHSQGLYLVQRIRDEAHRFAITAHRKARTRQGLASRLDAIPGIGPARRKQLLQRFGSLEGIQQASLEDLMSLKGITEDIARHLKDNL